MLSVSLVSAWVDPRVCGVASPLSPLTAASLGRSPRMRGSRAFGALYFKCVGSIPAYAG